MESSSHRDTIDQNYRPLGSAVSESSSGQRVDRYLAENFRFLSRSAWQQRLREGTVLVNGSPAKVGYRVHPGDCLHYHYPAQKEPPVPTDISCLWHAGEVMAISKPSGLPMHENGPYRHHTFAHLVREFFGPEWSAIHRLDLETSGIVLCAATPQSRARLASDLRRQRIRKTYLAIVEGSPLRDQWQVDAPIGDLADSRIRIKKGVVTDGLPAQTKFFVHARSADRTLIEAQPITGRTNQIRIHAAWSGHRIVGDKLYHADENVFLKFFEHGLTEDVISAAGHTRLCLHASQLDFIHPVTNKRVIVTSALPADMDQVWRANRDKKL